MRKAYLSDVSDDEWVLGALKLDMEFLQRVGRVYHLVIPPDADVHGLPYDVWD
jgi:hypothetical protein